MNVRKSITVNTQN